MELKMTKALKTLRIKEADSTVTKKSFKIIDLPADVEKERVALINRMLHRKNLMRPR